MDFDQRQKQEGLVVSASGFDEGSGVVQGRRKEDGAPLLAHVLARGPVQWPSSKFCRWIPNGKPSIILHHNYLLFHVWMLAFGHVRLGSFSVVLLCARELEV